jgi:hypothetical protein
VNWPTNEEYLAILLKISSRPADLALSHATTLSIDSKV